MRNDKIAIAATLALMCLPIYAANARAADFSKVRKTYVPPSMIDRRVDFSTLREHQSTTSFTGGISSSARRISGTSGKKPELTVSTHSIVPPPPPTGNAVLAGKAAAAARNIHTQASKIAASPQVQSALASMRDKATELARSGQFDEAKGLAARILQQAPQDTATLKAMAGAALERAQQFVNSGEMDKALQYGRQALVYDGNNLNAKKTVEGLLLKAGVDPKSPEARLQAADQLAAQGKHDEAFAEYDAALKLKPSADAHVGIGNVAMQAGQRERARLEYQAALRLDPKSAAAYRQLGVLKHKEGDIVGANTSLSKALIVNPKDTEAGKHLVDLWQQQVAQVPSANSHLGLARAYQLSGNLQAAQSEYRTVVRLDPHNEHLPAARQSFKQALARKEAEHSLEAARTLEVQGAMLEASHKAREAVTLNPRDAELRVYHGHLLEKLQQYGPAREAYMSALKLNPKHALAAARIKNLPGGAPALAASSVPPIPGAAPTLRPQIPTSDPVSNISNFATALRDQMLAQKNQISTFESIAQTAMNNMGAGGLAGLGGANSAGESTATLHTFAEPLDDTTSGDVPEGLDDLLASASQSVAEARSGGAPLPTAFAGSVPTTATAANSTPVWVPNSAPAESASTEIEPPLAPPIATTMANRGPGGFTSPLKPVGHDATAKTASLRQPMPAPGAVRLELEGAAPNAGRVELAVILHNDGDVPIKVPEKLKAVIHYAKRRPAEVSPQFAEATVPAHGAIRGIIPVPFDKVDPSADLVLKGLLPAGNAQRDVHLITSVASR